MNKHACISIYACMYAHTNSHTHTHTHSYSHTLKRTYTYIRTQAYIIFSQSNVKDCSDFTAALMTFLSLLFSTCY